MNPASFLPRHPPWDWVFLAGFAVYVVIRGVFEERTRRNVRIVDRRDRGEVALMALVGVGSILLPLLYLFTPWLARMDFALPRWAPRVGLLAMVSAIWLFYRSHADLGQNWFVTLALREGHTLVSTGVYSRIRHPMYAAILLWGVAQGLLLQNWLAGWGAVATFAPLVLVRLPREERMMCEHFGEEYRAYMGRTGRLFPRRAARGNE